MEEEKSPTTSTPEKVESTPKAPEKKPEEEKGAGKKGLHRRGSKFDLQEKEDQKLYRVRHHACLTTCSA